MQAAADEFFLVFSHFVSRDLGGGKGNEERKNRNVKTEKRVIIATTNKRTSFYREMQGGEKR